MLEVFSLSDDVVSLIYEWRQDPLTCQMSRHLNVKERGAFERDLKRVIFFDPPPLFFVEEGIRKAYFFFKPAEVGVEISFNVAPSQRGKGVATRALKEVISWLKTRQVEAVVAFVKVDNQISKTLLKKAGFDEVSFKEVFLEDTGELISMYELILNLREKKSDVFIIAEAGSNFKCGSLKEDKEMASRLILAAKEAGCDAVKFQTFKSETTYVPNAGLSGYLNEEITAVFKQLEMPYEMLPFLKESCDKAQIEFMSTPFSEKDFLAIDPFVKRHKIASYENGFEALIKLAANSNKPTFISTGASTMTDIEFAVETFFEAGGNELTLMQCTAKYEASIEALNLLVIPMLRNKFQVDVGLSDHSASTSVAPIVAVSLGAKVIEKHFTLDKKMKGPDHKFALNPLELKQLVLAIRETEKALGSSFKKVEKEEEELFYFAKRGIQALSPIRKGEVFSHENIGVLRPGNQKKGIAPRHLKALLGKKAKKTLSLGEGVQWEDFE